VRETTGLFARVEKTFRKERFGEKFVWVQSVCNVMPRETADKYTEKY
jgi:hypothetical protein